ncbi:hypothetical protein NXS08_06105 [Gleimia sp. 6138-11-ORH1]|uniref:hypothetical protein n=1 Tax=Gleimia sp. 6138-11-ORH1 TaxID=2973937 RepID=UPI002168A345|nr:hypothetical protein [Gleimia sp. 6138-11-ORH1]MCS4485040.1 hypothetical protein [Gleimia sp. 6138-11-ORH1]
MAEFTAIVSISYTVAMVGVFLSRSLTDHDVPALAKLHDPLAALTQVAIPALVCIFITRAVIHRRELQHVVWQEPEYVSPRLGGKAPVVAPPLDTYDDLFFAPALSHEPDPLIEIDIQPRVSRLWWLVGMLTVFGISIVFLVFLTNLQVSLDSVLAGTFAAAALAVAQEYLLRGLIVAEVRRFTKRQRWSLLVSTVLTFFWMIPISLTAATPTNVLVVLLFGTLLAVPAFALRRIFASLWAPIIGQFLFFTAFLVLL